MLLPLDPLMVILPDYVGMIKIVDLHCYLGINISSCLKDYLTLNLTPVIGSLRFKCKSLSCLPLSVAGRTNLI